MRREDYRYTLDFLVRDYECDIEGIVNNAVYQNYLEHARHEFLKSTGISFTELAASGVNLVVVRAELDYRAPLRSGDRFWVGLNTERLSRVRFAFLQDIYTAGDDRLLCQGRIIGTALNARGRPTLPPEVEAVFGGC